MAIGQAEKETYKIEASHMKLEITELQKHIKEILLKQKQNEKLSGYYNLELAINYMKIIKLNLRISDLSMEMLGIKNDSAQNDARKNFFVLINAFENVVGGDVDRSLRSNDAYLARISQLTPAQILHIIKQLHLVFKELKEKVGGEGGVDANGKVLSGGSKWYWSFVELQARVAVVTKNITNFSDVARLRDPRTPYFKERKELMALCQTSLEDAAKSYRTRYELAGKARDDLKMTVEILSALRRINVLFANTEEAERNKNVIDALKQILAAEEPNKGKSKKK